MKLLAGTALLPGHTLKYLGAACAAEAVQLDKLSVQFATRSLAVEGGLGHAH